MKQVVCIEHPGLVNDGVPLSYANAPVITAQEYEQRISALLEHGAAYSHLIGYADKEHFSNLDYLIGYDPRYEECILVLRRDQLPVLILGNEGMGQSLCVTVPHKKVLFQALSPMGQSRVGSDPLHEIFRSCGVDSSSRVGVIGWKYFDSGEFEDGLHSFEVPAYLIAALGRLGAQPENAAYLLMDCGSGLRAVQDDKTIILSELASTKASRKVWEFMQALRPGMTELEASQYLNIDGEPCPTYPNICFSGRGILSPDYHTVLKEDTPIAFGMGYRFAQIHRVGMYTSCAQRFETAYPGVLEHVFGRYYAAVTAWFENLRLGATGGQVWEAVRQVIDDYGSFGIALNPGHLIASEEWLGSPFQKDNPVPLKSGMLVQCDFTARPAAYGGIGVHIEDGVVLADSAARERLRAMAPDSYQRMVNRREFMRQVLGIQVADEVLPTSDLCGVLHPFLANLNQMFANR